MSLFEAFSAPSLADTYHHSYLSTLCYVCVWTMFEEEHGVLALLLAMARDVQNVADVIEVVEVVARGVHSLEPNVCSLCHKHSTHVVWDSNVEQSFSEQSAHGVICMPGWIPLSYKRGLTTRSRALVKTSVNAAFSVLLSRR